MKTHIDQVTHTLEILVPPTVRAEPSDGNFVVRIVNPFHHHHHHYQPISSRPSPLLSTSTHSAITTNFFIFLHLSYSTFWGHFPHKLGKWKLVLPFCFVHCTGRAWTESEGKATLESDSGARNNFLTQICHQLDRKMATETTFGHWKVFFFRSH